MHSDLPPISASSPLRTSDPDKRRPLKRSDENVPPPQQTAEKIEEMVPARISSPKLAAASSAEPRLPFEATHLPNQPVDPKQRPVRCPLLEKLAEIAEEVLPPTHRESKTMALYKALNRAYWDNGPFIAPDHVDLSNKTVAMRLQNTHKNRYGNIFPYDGNIWMYQHPQMPEDFYLNASAFDVEGRLYVSTQGPLALTWVDFLSAIAVSGCRVVLTLVNPVEDGKNKTETWWERCASPVRLHGGYTIQLQDQEIFPAEALFNVPQLITRRFIVRDNQMNERIVTHLQYLNWRDHEAPPDLSLFLAMQDCVNRLNPGRTPVVGHCSAGCGRTGTWIAIDILWRKILAQLAAGKSPEHIDIDIIAEIIALRKMRPQMVQSVTQLRAIYVCLLIRLRDYLKER